MPNRKLQAKIKIAQKQLGIEDSIYRDILYRKFRVSSSTALSDSQAVVLINYFIDQGWVPKSKKPKKYLDSPRDPYDASGAIKRKVEAMWAEYHHNHCNCGDTTGHGRRWLFSKFKVSDINFLDRRKAYEAVEGLKAMQTREAAT